MADTEIISYFYKRNYTIVNTKKVFEGFKGAFEGFKGVFEIISSEKHPKKLVNIVLLIRLFLAAIP